MHVNDGTPAPTGEDKQWADLAAEVEVSTEDDEAPAPSGGDGEGGGEPRASSDEADATAEPAKQPIPYEELEKRARQTSAALKEAREREQSTREQLRAFNQMVEDLRAARKPAQETKQPDPAPDPNEDPVGYFEHKIAAQQAEIAELRKSTTETREEYQARTEYQQFMGVVSRHEAEFAAATPDYHQAAEYLEKGRRSELAIMFPDTPQGEAVARGHGYKSAAALREAVFVNDAQTVARNALQMGLNPAQAYYELAKGRGYKPGSAGGVTEDKNAKANGVIEAMRRGTKASKTLSGAGGAPDNPLNLSDLTDLYAEDPEEFDKQWDKMAKAGKLG